MTFWRDLARAKVAFQLRTIEAVIRGSEFDPARMERCEYCGVNRHVCGCEERFGRMGELLVTLACAAIIGFSLGAQVGI